MRPYSALLLCMTLLTAPLAADDSAGTGTVTGTILDARNRPAADFAVYLVRDEPVSAPRGPLNASASPPAVQLPTRLAPQIIDRAVTDENGKFAFPVVPVGAYFLRGGDKQKGFIYLDVVVRKNQTTQLGRIKIGKT
ncbi:MAG TPA: carboxypeptidase-like regulatory domain-containing protein [Tepidisphaeraceae bacterium]|nr:carboxypeptidase-like regulatory domain-containing protein [Tepidisphaeraceae bacterium]